MNRNRPAPAQSRSATLRPGSPSGAVTRNRPSSSANVVAASAPDRIDDAHVRARHCLPGLIGDGPVRTRSAAKAAPAPAHVAESVKRNDGCETAGRSQPPEAVCAHRVPFGVSRAEERTPPWPSFLTRGSMRRVCLPKRGQWPAPTRLYRTSTARSSDICDVPLPAYSGGTVWALHPLRVAAGVSV